MGALLSQSLSQTEVRALLSISLSVSDQSGSFVLPKSVSLVIVGKLLPGDGTCRTKNDP